MKNTLFNLLLTTTYCITTLGMEAPDSANLQTQRLGTATAAASIDTTTSTQHSSSSQQKITVKTMDEKEFSIPIDVAKQAQTIKDMLEDISADIAYIQCSAKDFEMLLPFMEQMKQIENIKARLQDIPTSERHTA